MSDTDTNITWPEQRDLYDYQRRGVERVVKRGFGALWDEPGLGKTTQAIVAAQNLGGRWLIVCPSMLKRQWRNEIIKIYPEDRNKIAVSTVGGRFIDPEAGRRHEMYPHIYEKKYGFPKWTITHYTGARLSEAGYARVKWTGVVLDEAHYIKNRKAQRSKAVLKITPKMAYRITLTATPYGVNPADIWHQLYWLCPDVDGLQSYWRWFNIFVDYSWEENNRSGHRYRQINGGKNLDLLSEVMRAYGVLRTKEAVAPQLPPVTHTDMPLEMSARQETIYDALKERDRVELVVKHTDDGAEERDLPITGMLIKNALSRLVKMEQWLSHPWTIDPGTDGSKLEWLLWWVKEYQRPAVITTRFRASAKRIAEELGTKAIEGSVPLKLREPILEEWEKGEKQYLVGTIGTIGTGTNLQRAHTMVCYDQVYSPVRMDQLYQRIHRIDSDHPVEIIYLYNEDTSNEVVLEAFRDGWNQMQLVRRYVQHLMGKEGSS